MRSRQLHGAAATSPIARVRAAVQRTASRIRIAEIARYGVITVLGYGFLYLGTYLLVERGGMAPDVAYMLLLTTLYAGIYVSYSAFVFKQRFTASTLRRFVVALVFTWALNNALFYVLNQVFALHYLAVITLNLVLLGGVRFCVQRFYVFRATP